MWLTFTTPGRAQSLERGSLTHHALHHFFALTEFLAKEFLRPLCAVALLFYHLTEETRGLLVACLFRVVRVYRAGFRALKA